MGSVSLFALPVFAFLLPLLVKEFLKNVYFAFESLLEECTYLCLVELISPERIPLFQPLSHGGCCICRMIGARQELC